METTAVLITGGGGFIGSHLAEFYLGFGCSVICVDNFATGSQSNLEYLKGLPNANKKLQFIEADVSRPWSIWTEQIRNQKLKISHVFHFASPASPAQFQRLSIETIWVNTLGLQEALLFSDSVNARLIFASTSEVYGDPLVSPQNESYSGNVNTIGPRACYDESKRLGETLLFNHNIRYQTNHGIVRIFNTYGPRMNLSDGRVVINFLIQTMLGEKLTIYGNGEQTRSFCYIADLIDGIHQYAISKISAPMNLGNDIECTILQLAKKIGEKFPDRKIELDFYPLPQNDPHQRKPDLSFARRELSSWNPRVSLEEGLSKMVSWLQEQDLSNYSLPRRPQ